MKIQLNIFNTLLIPVDQRLSVLTGHVSSVLARASSKIAKKTEKTWFSLICCALHKDNSIYILQMVTFNTGTSSKVVFVASVKKTQGEIECKLYF